MAAKGGLTIAGIGIAAEIFAPPILPNEGSSAPAGNRFDEIERRARVLFAGAIFQHALSTAGDNGRDFWPAHPARPRLFGGFAFQEVWSGPIMPVTIYIQSSIRVTQPQSTFREEDGMRSTLRAGALGAVGLLVVGLAACTAAPEPTGEQSPNGQGQNQKE